MKESRNMITQLDSYIKLSLRNKHNRYLNNNWTLNLKLLKKPASLGIKF